MRNPFWRLKSLPWAILLQVALAAVAIATIADLLLAQGLALLLGNVGSGLLPLMQLLFMALPIAAGFGIGALGLTILERRFGQVHIDTGVLWALVPCIALVLFVKGFLPIPTALVAMSYPLLVGVLLGIFVVGKRHWRRW
ncbi:MULTISPECIES: peptide chain release factor 1 [Cyanophyceae]|uniref:peptide chain release factor 1 n=1 Tax=Cyanophyceae TaxID=3028117 RepID=UPI00168502CC|nr:MULTISPECIES: peptide chain release factor 1 [Cyanophyceae]MBD1916529.1 peptide chain release factor 1 [Phormidium sp. FACHB-77]MBD2032096.1 peptide chain release factor 1 [Phormidium sp. FACHB-322]MBD2052976.1 peptide chain release factor 1 [Leptolyngbya sp. FACHB-60]